MSQEFDPQEPRPEATDSSEASSTELTPAPETKVTAAVTNPPVEPEEDTDDDEGMLRMSFLEHLEELRTRIIRALMGVAVAFAGCIFFANELWDAVREPAVAALQQLGLDTNLAQISPPDVFTIIYVRLPVLAALFVASPWVLYQVWAFIAPGLYKKERRLATPFILSCAGLFILGGLFAYFIAFRFGLVFLLGIGVGSGIKPMISVTEYFDLFVNVILGVALVFELPILIFFLTLLRIASPRFLIRNSRYAILLIVVAAAVITPTPDVYNLTIFAAPMVLLYFVGVFASYLLVLSREGKKFPWGVLAIFLVAAGLVIAASLYVLVTKYGFQLVNHWPYLTR